MGSTKKADSFFSRASAHALVVVGFVLSFLVLGLCLLGPYFTNQSPDTQRTWLGLTKPCSSEPWVLAHFEFKKGEISPVPDSWKGANKIELTHRELNYTDYRVLLRRDKVVSIMKLEGGLPLSKLVWEQKKDRVLELLVGDKEGEEKTSFELYLNEPAPLGFAKKNQRVLLLRAYGAQDKNISVLRLDQQDRVLSLETNGKEKSSLTLSGGDILRVMADDKELREFHLLGTDSLGRDLLVRIFYGGRISILVGVVATTISVLLGVLYGSIAGYKGGQTDRMMMAAVDILYSLPFMFLVILLFVIFERNLLVFFLALGSVQWLTMARIVRGQVLSLKSLEYIEAARLSGGTVSSIFLKHLLPNVLGTVVVYATLTVPLVILEESFLSFLGLSIQFDGRSLDSWGTLIHDGAKALGNEGQRSWLLIAPSIFMGALLLGLNLLGDGLRDVLDPRLRSRSR